MTTPTNQPTTTHSEIFSQISSAIFKKKEKEMMTIMRERQYMREKWTNERMRESEQKMIKEELLYRLL